MISFDYYYNPKISWKISDAEPIRWIENIHGYPNKKSGPLMTLPLTIINIKMNLISATVFYKAFKLSI